MNPSFSRPHRLRRGDEHGFTLIEALVSIAILAVIGAAMGTIFSVGFRTMLAPGSASDHLTAAGDLMSFQRSLSQDVERAECVEALGQGPYGACAPFAGRCTQSDICVQWADITANACDVAVYSSSSWVQRQLWVSGSSQSPMTARLTSQPIAFSHATLRANEIQLTVVPMHGETATLDLRPLATQPSSAVAGAPC